MDKNEKIQFVLDHTRIIAGIIVRLIDGEKVPDDWDGLELRWLIADKFADHPYTKSKNAKRARRYNNDVIVNNL